MGFYMDKDDLRSVKYVTAGQIGKWEKKLGNTAEILEKISSLESFRGTAADSVKSYLQEIHGLVRTGVASALMNYKAVMNLYVDGYEEIDAHLHAVLKQDTLETAQQDYSTSAAVFEGTQAAMLSILGSVSDLAYIAFPFSNQTESDYLEVAARVRNLVTKVESHESNSSSSDIAQLREVISRVRAYIREQLESASDYPVRYQSGDFQYGTNIYDLAIAVQSSNNYFLQNEEKLKRAFETEQKVQKALEKEAQEERIGNGVVQIVIGTITVVGCVSVIIASCGTAAPAAITIAAGVSSAMGTAYGLSEITEGLGDTVYGLSGDITSAAWNPIRDTVFQGNEKAYEAWGKISTTVSSLCMPAMSGITAAKISGEKAAFVIGKEIAKDKIIGYIGDKAGDYVVAGVDKYGDMKEYQKTAIKEGTSKAVSKGLEKIDEHFDKSFRTHMDEKEQKRYDEYWLEKARQRDEGEVFHPNDLDAKELGRMQKAENRLKVVQFEQMAYEDSLSYEHGGGTPRSTVCAFSSERYEPYYFEGTVKVGGEEVDVSRRVYQKTNIDLNLVDSEGHTNLERMLSNDPPIGSDGYSIELHHITQEEPGTMVEIEHNTHEKYRKQLHGLYPERESFRNNDVLNRQYNNFRNHYWRNRALQILQSGGGDV